VPANPAPAATVVLLRPGPNGPEALLTRRPATMTFAPDVHVFPGGRVDAADADPGLLDRSVVSAASATTALGGDLEPVVALAAYVAAIREAFEEVGILLADVRGSLGDLPEARRRLLAEPGSFPAIAARLDLRLRTDRLVPLSRWVTPPTLARRFDARFFAAAVPGDADADLVGDEVVDHGWHRPSDALDAMAAGTFELWLPTAMTLAQLEHASSIDVIARSAPGRLGLVSVEAVSDDIVRIEMPAGGGVAGQPIDAYLVGRRRFVLVDPGDPTGPGLERAMDEAAARGGRIAAIAITLADPDHVGGAEALREQLGVDVITGPGGGRRLPHDVREVVDGDVIGDGDVPLRVVATPGQRRDAVAFLIGDGHHALTGDLDGRRGARTIPGPVDDDALRASIALLSERAPNARWLSAHPGPPDPRR
jgi:glyoxylase-like metal-dependent hydrolase (beta-lactamase superfamily II)/8-oxo-dGTP pyrophosphatase MutT (NUDIX family)